MPESLTDTAPRASVFAAALWSVGTRWTNRFIGLLSTLALVRLLSPDDFGVMAMAMLVIGMVEVVMDFGTTTWLMQKRDATPQDFSLVWTLRLLQLAGVGSLIAIAAPLAGDYFKDPRVVWVMWALAGNAALSGLDNLATVVWEKALDFRRAFQLSLVRRLLTAAATLGSALALQSYWALVIGMVVHSLVGIALSYRLCAFRPHWTLRGAGPLLTASKWLLLQSLSGYLNARVDAFLLGRNGGPAAVGIYTLSQEVSTLPTVELLSPMSRALLPGLVRLRDQPAALQHAYLLATGIQATVAMPMAVGMAMTAHLIVPVLLGPKWLESIPILQVLAMVAGISTFTYSSSYLQIALGRFRFMAALSALSTIGFVVLGLTAFDFSHPLEIAWARCLMAALTTLILVASVMRIHKIASTGDLLRSYARPAVATGVMAAVLGHIGSSASLPAVPAIGLLVLVAAGAAIYTGVLVALWWLQGRPVGPERYLLSKLPERWR